jgi:hypothetical protein
LDLDRFFGFLILYTVRLFSKYNYNDQVKEDEMGRACSTNGGEDACIYDIGGKSRRKETTGKTKT